MIGVTLTAGAMGYDLWGWIPVWNAEEIHFVRETQDPTTVSTISVALQKLSIDEELFPKWLPDGFVLTESRIEAKPLFLHEYYVDNNDRHISITILPIDGLGGSVYQKTDASPMEYKIGTITHYIVSNSNEITDIWYTDDFAAVVMGNITMEEMKKLIDSIYEV